jgi:hypothetical protein
MRDGCWTLWYIIRCCWAQGLQADRTTRVSNSIRRTETVKRSARHWRRSWNWHRHTEPLVHGHTDWEEDDFLLGRCAVYCAKSFPTFQRCLLRLTDSPDDGGSKDLWNIGEIPDNTTQQRRGQLCSYSPLWNIKSHTNVAALQLSMTELKRVTG